MKKYKNASLFKKNSKDKEVPEMEGDYLGACLECPAIIGSKNEHVKITHEKGKYKGSIMIGRYCVECYKKAILEPAKKAALKAKEVSKILSDMKPKIILPGSDA